mgnify:CR=1 FL=1
MSIKSKIVAVSNDLRLTKDGENPFQKFSYFKPDDILKALNPLLEKYNLFMSFNLPYNHEKAMYEAVLYFEDLEDKKQNITYKFDIPLTKVAGASEAQGAGATMTYAKRYSIMNAFSIADNSDDLDAKPAFKTSPNAKNGAPQAISNEKGGICPECQSNMVIKTGRQKTSGKTWRGQQCTNKNCIHYSRYIFLPDMVDKDLELKSMGQQSQLDDLDAEAQNQQDEFYGRGEN